MARPAAAVQEARCKEPTTAILLALFLGGLGAHHVYLSNTGIRILYAIFVWTFVPAIIAFFEPFPLKGRVERKNDERAHEFARAVKAHGD